MVASFKPNNEEGNGELIERRDQVMMIRTKIESVFYPVSKQRVPGDLGTRRRNRDSDHSRDGRKLSVARSVTDPSGAHHED